MDDFICMDPKNNVINESSIQPVRHGQGRRLRPIDGSDNPVRKRTVPLKPKAVTIVPMQRFEWSQKIQSPPKRQSSTDITRKAQSMIITVLPPRKTAVAKIVAPRPLNGR
eukprot:scaffold449_cov184-Amphora_coffeaeformis.AAC.21